MTSYDLNRRGALAAGLALSVWPRAAFAAGPTDKRLVVILLRGAMDGLSAAPAFGDPDYERARNGLAIPRPGQDAEAALDLDGFFGLSPALKGLHGRFAKGELAVLHAIASPYRDRSHFDGQNLIENGSDRPYGLADGWVNRALVGLPAPLSAGRSDPGVALAPSMPLMMRGPARVTSWSPSLLPAPSPDLVARIKALYEEGDPKLAQALTAAANANPMAGVAEHGDGFAALMQGAARFLKEPSGPCVAVVESNGWDTHANQLGPFGVLSRNLAALDHGVDLLAEGLGATWADTAVIVVTEFGRTVAMNGTRGSDHGSASVAFLAGGAVKGGRVIADWPGLSAGALYQGRDLKPTADMRALFKAALIDHLGVSPAHVERVVFPDSASVRPMAGLFRAG
jgi:uncharacterized protein (DUF1501 family)